MGNIVVKKSFLQNLLKERSILEGGLNVRGKNNLGNISDRWFHDVYFVVLLFSIHRHPFGESDLLQEAIENKKNRIYGENKKSVKKW